MIVGVPREIKPGEQRVALTPAGAHALVDAGHRVLVEQEAGSGSAVRDEEYAKVGASLCAVDAVWSGAEMILVERMKDCAVIVDVAVDQGGCIETIHATTLLEPIYRVAGVVHYGVANMPALVPRTSTFALTNATLPYVVELAGAVRDDPALARGVNIWRGRIVHPGVAESIGERATPLATCLG